VNEGQLTVVDTAVLRVVLDAYPDAVQTIVEYPTGRAIAIAIDRAIIPERINLLFKLSISPPPKKKLFGKSGRNFPNSQVLSGKLRQIKHPVLQVESLGPKQI
jgi:hypothetical protein